MMSECKESRTAVGACSPGMMINRRSVEDHPSGGEALYSEPRTPGAARLDAIGDHMRDTGSTRL